MMKRGYWMSLACASVVACSDGAVLQGCEPAPACDSDDDCGFARACTSGECTDTALSLALPALPPEDGTLGADAHIVTDASELPRGEVAQGRAGDIIMRNGVAAFVIQKAGRDFGATMFGGNVIDAVLVRNGEMQPDVFGEVMPFLNMGMSVNFADVQVVRTGARGGPAVVRAVGNPALWDFINLRGFLGDGFSELTPFDPDEPLELTVVATYVLFPGERALRVTYTVLNRAGTARQMPVGVVVDSGGEMELFRADKGFGTAAYNVQAILDDARSVPWWGYMGREGSVALRPRTLDGDVTRVSYNPTVQVAGITVSFFDREDVLAALGESDFFLRSGEAASYGFDLAVSDGNLAGAAQALYDAQGVTPRTLVVRVTQEGSSMPVTEALVMARTYSNGGELQDPIIVGRTGGDGRVTLPVPAEPLFIQVSAAGHVESAGQRVEMTASAVDVALGAPGNLGYVVERTVRVDDPSTEPGPCRITVVGAPQVVDDVLSSAANDRPPAGVSVVRSSGTCRSADDGPLPLVPGRYLVVITAGPHFDALQQLVDVGVSGARVTGTLHRVVDPGDYASTDWHQHAVNSPDAPVGNRQRLLGYLAEGIDLFGGSDHDFITDWEHIVEELGFADRIQAINGVESTTFDYGHFNMFPLRPDPASVNGGAVDWAGGDGPGLAPPQVWQRYREKGVQVVQVNHPLGNPGGYFTRAALTFELDRTTMRGVARGDPGRQPATNEQLRLPPLEPLWSAEFDAVEAYNGFSRYGGARPTRPPGDRRVDQIIGHVGNLVHVGHRPIMTGTSDTHRAFSGANGYPRTYVAARRTASGTLDPWSILGALAGLGAASNRGNVVMSNGPLPQVTARTSTSRPVGPGGLVTGSGTITFHVEVQAPAWMKLETADLVVSPLMESLPGNAPPFTPTHATSLVAREEVLGSGGTRTTYTADIALNATDNPFPGRDMFVLVRVHSDEPLWPVVFAGVALDVDENADTPEAFASATDGVTPYAVTNPFYVDVDGDGVFKGAFQP